MPTITLDTNVKIAAARIDIASPGDATGVLRMTTYAWKGTSKIWSDVVITDYPLDADDAYWASDVPPAIVDAWAGLGYIQP